MANAPVVSISRRPTDATVTTPIGDEESLPSPRGRTKQSNRPTFRKRRIGGHSWLTQRYWWVAAFVLTLTVAMSIGIGWSFRLKTFRIADGIQADSSVVNNEIGPF